MFDKEYLESCCLLKSVTLFIIDGNGGNDDAASMIEESLATLNLSHSKIYHLQRPRNDMFKSHAEYKAFQEEFENENDALVDTTCMYESPVKWLLDLAMYLQDVAEIVPIHKRTHVKLVVSTMCFMPSQMPPSLPPHVNICLAHASKMTIHDVRSINASNASNDESNASNDESNASNDKSNASNQIVALNGLFFGRNDNVFHSTSHFVEQFRKMAHFAKLLGATNLIYGSTPSKTISVSMSKEYPSYLNAHIAFSNVMRSIAREHPGLTIYIKPNKKESGCNYLFDDDQVTAMVAEINCENIKQGPMRRDQILTAYEDFDLLEYDASCYANPRALIDHFLGCS